MKKDSEARIIKPPTKKEIEEMDRREKEARVGRGIITNGLLEVGKVSPEFQKIIDAIYEWKKVYDDRVNILISCAKVDKEDNFLEEDNYLLVFLNTYMEFKKPFIRGPGVPLNDRLWDISPDYRTTHKTISTKLISYKYCWKFMKFHKVVDEIYMWQKANRETRQKVSFIVAFCVYDEKKMEKEQRIFCIELGELAYGHARACQAHFDRTKDAYWIAYGLWQEKE